MKPHVAILSLKARMDWLLSKNRNDHRLSQHQTETNGCWWEEPISHRDGQRLFVSRPSVFGPHIPLMLMSNKDTLKVH